jgi:hypothetical protein
MHRIFSLVVVAYTQHMDWLLLEEGGVDAEHGRDFDEIVVVLLF